MEYFLQEGEENFWIRWHAKQILHYLEGVKFSVDVRGSMSEMAWWCPTLWGIQYLLYEVNSLQG